uniref:TSA: Wollemia nobilis Ref_Wollemi_Transcript_13459_4557 transcribed RNA sequence n=1 Tax=Wollemia nobilis TaxID=56998 RepID=A0A0C9RTU1_9CONI
MLLELKKLIEANPLFREKLQFPGLKASRLRTLINQSLNWQHQLCKNPRPNPDIKTLFVDHNCGQQNGARPPQPANNFMGAFAKSTPFPPTVASHTSFQPAPSNPSSALTGWMANPAPVTHPALAAGPVGLSAGTNAATLVKRPRTPVNTPPVDYQSGDSEHILKRARPVAQQGEEVSYQGSNHLQCLYSQDDLPKTVAQTLNQGSPIMSMDFHPVQQTVLLVGTSGGEISIWEVGSRERLASRNFKVWDLSSCSVAMQAAVVKDPVVSVNRVVWSPDGALFGVAYSKHIVHIYTYHGGNEMRHHLEIDAHVGGVNDLSFSHPNKQLCIITCGDDKTIKVWDAITGRKLYTFDGHEAPVYSVCPHHKENIQFIFSTAIDGKIKAWLYDHMGSRVDYDAPGHWCTTMAYSADGSRLFSCGTSKEGESFLVEWNESEGAIKRTYQGFRKRSLGVVQFDTTRNRFLAAGDEYIIKFWDMDNTNLLTTVDAEGGLQASPRLRFNKDGSLLAVSTENGIKILANADGLRLLRTFENRSLDAARIPPEPVSKVAPGNTLAIVNASAGPSTLGTERGNTSVSISTLNGDTRSVGEVKVRVTEEAVEKTKSWKLMEVIEPGQCRSLKLPDNLNASKVSRLIYTNSGVAILALASNAVHKLWKWQRNERNSSGKATATVLPQLWQPASGILMTNDISDTNPEDAVPCFALSKNDSYVMSASGGKVSLFNMMTFKTMTTFMAPPPAATFLAFHPQDNNIIAIGMEDSTIQIYNVRVDEVKSKLKGHQKRITGLAFSHVLNVLVSSGADAQICVWGIDTWEKQKSKPLQIPASRPLSSQAVTRVQFHQDQIHFLAVHETQLAIYETTKLDRIKQWVPHESLSAPISNAAYSCDSQLIYASFCDGAVGVFHAETLKLRCRIAATAYFPPSVSISSVYPLVVAAHPSEPNQFSLGLSDGSVIVLEPSESEGRWGTGPPAENGPVSSVSVGPKAGTPGPEQGPR